MNSCLEKKEIWPLITAPFNTVGSANSCCFCIGLWWRTQDCSSDMAPSLSFPSCAHRILASLTPILCIQSAVKHTLAVTKIHHYQYDAKTWSLHLHKEVISWGISLWTKWKQQNWHSYSYNLEKGPKLSPSPQYKNSVSARKKGLCAWTIQDAKNYQHVIRKTLCTPYTTPGSSTGSLSFQQFTTKSIKGL